MAKKVHLMMSGGVDSSVAAAELVEQGYSVTGVFIKCWSLEELSKLGLDEEQYACNWEEDERDARIVAEHLGVQFKSWDMREEYLNNVVRYMLEGYKNGITPNPDIMCNSVIKFGTFYDKAINEGADYVATGHYAQTINELNDVNELYEVLNNTSLKRGEDSNKDQSYFLWGVLHERIAKTLFPIGGYSSKSKLRERAKELKIPIFDKPDSQGICFIGETPLREILLKTLGSKDGDIIDTEGKPLGVHNGAFLYTIGQRNKLGLSGGPWYVKSIDIETNQVVVAHANEIEQIETSELKANNVVWHVNPKTHKFKCSAQVRYRQDAMECEVDIQTDETIKVNFKKPVRAIAKGQSIVLYDNDTLLAGGIIV